MKNVATLGEILVRLATPKKERFVQSNNFDIDYGGGEYNVAVSLAQFGVPTKFITALPDNPIGDVAINRIRSYGIDSSNIIRQGSRIGLYYLEHGAAMRPSKVVYDRARSSISEVELGDFNWTEIFKGTDWFHFTGITPALSKKAADVTLEAAKAAKAMGLTVSADMNYRKNLWSPEEAQKVMKPLMNYVDIAIGNEEDAEKCLGVSAENQDVTSGELNPDAYKDVLSKLFSEFQFKKIGITLRESLSASDNNWSAVYSEGDKMHVGQKYSVHMVDRVGGGDAFSAGIIYGNIQEMSAEATLKFAVASSALAHTIHGDLNLVSLAEVNAVAEGDTSGRVQR
jgi:2-dehydro-3-deoxygluconokinase